MKTNTIIYWVTTGLVSVMMLFSASQYLTNPQMAAAFNHIGFPAYFRIELAIAKIIGALVLIIPQVPVKFKEWAYVGFGIVFISACIAHLSSGDGIGGAIAPIVFLGILIVSYWFLPKAHKAVTQ